MKWNTAQRNIVTGIHRFKWRKRSGRVDSALQSLSLDFEEKSIRSSFSQAGLVTQHCMQVCKITLVKKIPREEPQMNLAQICHTFAGLQLLPAGVHLWNDTDRWREAMGENPDSDEYTSTAELPAWAFACRCAHSDSATGTQHVASTGVEDSDCPTHS